MRRYLTYIAMRKLLEKLMDYHIVDDFIITLPDDDTKILEVAVKHHNKFIYIPIKI